MLGTSGVLPRVLPFTQFHPGYTQLPRVKLGKAVQRFYPPTLVGLDDMFGLCIYVQLDADDSRDHVEICPEAAVIATQIADRIAKYHGFALIADYGHTGEKTDTFRVSHSFSELNC